MEEFEIPATSMALASLSLSAALLATFMSFASGDALAAMQRNAEKWCRESSDSETGRQAAEAVQAVFRLARATQQ